MRLFGSIVTVSLALMWSTAAIGAPPESTSYINGSNQIQPVTPSFPLPVTNSGSTTTELTGTITLTGTYQQVFPASSSRRGCLIQVKGTHAMLVFFGAQPTASSGAGYSLEASDGGVDGGSISCGLIGGGYATDAVWIEGTTNDTFEYSSQP